MRKAIVTSFDENYLNYSLVMAKSLSTNYHGHHPIDLVCLVPENILHLQSWYSEQVGSKNINIIFRAAPELLENISLEATQNPATPYVTSHAYQRVFVGSMLPEYEKAIYIDPDTLILRDIDPLLNYKSIHKFLAVLETVNSGRTVFNNDDFAYFNSGVFIADLVFWRSEKIEEKLVAWIKNNPNSIYAEQDSLNAVLSEYVAPLPFHFNFFEWIVENNKLMGMEYDNPMIVHFVGHEKPWGDKLVSKYSKMWRDLYQSLKV